MADRGIAFTSSLQVCVYKLTKLLILGKLRRMDAIDNASNNCTRFGHVRRLKNYLRPVRYAELVS